MGGRSFFHFLVKWGGHYKMLWGVKNFKNCKVTPPTIKHKRVQAFYCPNFGSKGREDIHLPEDCEELPLFNNEG